MNTFFTFLYEFLAQFFSGIKAIILGIINGIAKMFGIKQYLKIVGNYKSDFGIGEWILFGIAAAILVALIVAFVLLIIFLLRKYIRFR